MLGSKREPGSTSSFMDLYRPVKNPPATGRGGEQVVRPFDRAGMEKTYEG